MTQEQVKEIVLSAVDDATAIRNLAALTSMEYARMRKGEAEKLGVTVGVLDEVVKEARKLLKSESSTQAQESPFFAEIAPWSESVELADLLEEMTVLFHRFIILPPHADIALALWVVFSWCIDAMHIAPILAIVSPEKRCGKTTVLSVLIKLVKCPLPASNISPAAVFRSIEKYAITLVIDEADTFVRQNEELRGVLNSGHSRITAYVIRTVGEDHDPKTFRTWGAKIIALIGKLPETLQDRSIAIELKRKTGNQKTEKLRHADHSVFEVLQRKLARFAQDNLEILKTIRPDLPSKISDRAQDNWEPLLAIAQMAGNAWSAKAFEAARALSSDNEPLSVGAELLADIQEIFEQRKLEKILSSNLIEALCSNEERPWATYNRGRPISPRQIAARLEEYGIKSKNIRTSYGVNKGYTLEQFHDAFLRYLSSPSENAATELHPTKHEGFAVADTINVASAVYAPATEKPLIHGDCSVVAASFQTPHRKEEVEVFEL